MKEFDAAVDASLLHIFLVRDLPTLGGKKRRKNLQREKNDAKICVK